MAARLGPATAMLLLALAAAAVLLPGKRRMAGGHPRPAVMGVGFWDDGGGREVEEEEDDYNDVLRVARFIAGNPALAPLHSDDPACPPAISHPPALADSAADAPVPNVVHFVVLKGEHQDPSSPVVSFPLLVCILAAHFNHRPEKLGGTF